LHAPARPRLRGRNVDTLTMQCGPRAAREGCTGCPTALSARAQRHRHQPFQPRAISALIAPRASRRAAVCSSTCSRCGAATSWTPIGSRLPRVTGTVSAGQSVPASGCVNHPSAGPVGIAWPPSCSVGVPIGGARRASRGRSARRYRRTSRPPERCASAGSAARAGTTARAAARARESDRASSGRSPAHACARARGGRSHFRWR